MRLTKIALVLAGLLLALPAMAEPVTLRFWVAWDPAQPDAKAMQAQIAAFEQAHPDIRIETQNIAFSALHDKLVTAVAGGDAPDISWGLPEWFGELYRMGALLDLTPYAADWPGREAIYPNVIEALTIDGKLMAMPHYLGIRALLYHEETLKKAGVAAPPKTWDEFTADAQKITALGDGTVGYAMPLGPEEAQAEFSIWMFNNGGNWKTDDKWTINSPQNVDTLTFLKTLSVNDKVTQNNPGKTNRTDGAFPLFQSGKAGMVVGFSPLAATLDKDAKVKYATAPMPTKSGGAPATYGVTDYLMAFKKPGNQDAVKAFYDLYYSPDQVNTFIKAEGFLPVTESGVKQFSSDPKLKTYLDTLTGAKLTPTDDPNWDRVKLAVQQNIGAAVAPTGDPKAVLDKLQAQAESGG